MKIHLVTIFPQFFEGPFSCGIVSRARQAGLLDIRIHDLRDWTADRHRTVDDRPFGGDEGMVLKVEPIYAALRGLNAAGARKVLLSAQGPLFDQAAARRLAGYAEIVLVCGRYEGVDERVAERLMDEELSVGNFVLTGGEWAAGIVVDSVARLLPGVVGNASSTERESFTPDEAGRVGILDYPHYTRPASFEAEGETWEAPSILLSGRHEQIAEWRRQAALTKTRRNRPDLLAGRRFA